MLDCLVSEVRQPDTQPSRIDTKFLDGMRGFAALFGALHHTYFDLCGQITLPHYLAFITYVLYLGRGVVDMFIVLSGFCLMLPVTRTRDWQLPQGIWQFLCRRARRVLLPYYAAMACTLLFIACCPWLRGLTNTLWSGIYPVFDVDVILSHLLVVQNLNPDWSHKINYPMWSIATEWQMYFVFALILLPTWRRFGLLVSAVVAFILGYGTLLLFPATIENSSPHFVALFMIGMITASVATSTSEKVNTWKSNRNWGMWAIVFLTPLCIPRSLFPFGLFLPIPIKDLLIGLATASFISYCTSDRSARHNAPLLIVRLLKSRLSLWIGSFAYSLTLTHAPVSASLLYLLRSYHLSPALTFYVEMAAAVPVMLLVAYSFHVVFERPFIKHPKQAPVRKNAFPYRRWLSALDLRVW